MGEEMDFTITELLDDLSELAYVVDPETHEVLYINETGKAMFQISDYAGLKCHEVFQGLDAPCGFCTAGFAPDKNGNLWERQNPKTGRYYTLKDRSIRWKGRPAHIEIAFDFTEHEEERRMLRGMLDAEKMVMQCVRQLHRETDLAKGVNAMLAQLGEELEAERTYIFEIADGKMSNTYEWCRTGVAPQIGNLQRLDAVLITRWESHFKHGECVIIENLEDIRATDRDEYDGLVVQGIKSLVSAPLESSGQLVGFVGVDNPVVERIHSIGPVLSTLSYFLMATMSRMAGEQKLRALSYTDTLTGLYNRNRFMQDVEKRKARCGALGVAYMDLNGLKEINDYQGHASGDEALVECSEALQAVFPFAGLYRIGGDEFVVLQEDLAEREFETLLERLRAWFDDKSVYHVAIGAKWSPDGADVDDMLQLADTEMYNDKRRYYRTHKSSSRYRLFSEDEKFSKSSPLLKEYNMLMSAMRVSVSKHLLEKKFTIVWANDYFYAMTGYSKEEYTAKFHGNCAEYFAADFADYEKLCGAVRKAFNAGEPGYESILHIPCKDGSYIWINVVGTFTDEQIDGIPVVYAVFTNVTDIMQMQKEQTVAYDSLPGFVAKIQITEKGPLLLYGNRNFSQFFGEPLKSGVERPLIRRALDENSAVVTAHYPQLRAGKPVTLEARAVNVDGESYYFQVYADCVDHVLGDPVYLALFLDITEMEKQRVELRRIAFEDSVTGGRNRMSFEIDAGGALRSATAGMYALVSMDIQKFKVINDLFGIQAGDSTLRYVYNKMVDQLWEGEFAARLSSDTFNLLLKAEPPDQLERRIATLVEDINSFNKGKEHKYVLVMTAGIYYVDDPTLPMTQLQDRANVARKQIKSVTGTQLCHCRFYNNGDRLKMAREKDIENRMSDALHLGEFVVYLQPKQDLRTGIVAGAEALVRWNDPKKGLVPPDEFIPQFERNGFIVELDLYVFELVCKLLRGWLDRGCRPVPISVNMSRVHLRELQYLQRYESIRNQYGVPPELLEIEITETVVLENPQLLSRIIDELHRLGYRCSMDDFGSGYSSLNVLKSIRVDTLKLDKAFFETETVNDPREAAIISTVVDLARRLDMVTVAEGVETQAQAEFLQRAGCDYIQGYLFSRPVPPERFEELVFLKAQN